MKWILNSGFLGASMRVNTQGDQHGLDNRNKSYTIQLKKCLTHIKLKTERKCLFIGYVSLIHIGGKVF